MKKLLLPLLLLTLSFAQGQSVFPIQADSVLMEAFGGSPSELLLRNSTKSVVGGALVNVGNGKTEFQELGPLGPIPEGCDLVSGADTLTLLNYTTIDTTIAGTDTTLNYNYDISHPITGLVQYIFGSAGRGVGSFSYWSRNVTWVNDSTDRITVLRRQDKGVPFTYPHDIPIKWKLVNCGDSIITVESQYPDVILEGDTLIVGNDTTIFLSSGSGVGPLPSYTYYDHDTIVFCGVDTFTFTGTMTQDSIFDGRFESIGGVHISGGSPRFDWYVRGHNPFCTSSNVDKSYFSEYITIINYGDSIDYPTNHVVALGDTLEGITWYSLEIDDTEGTRFKVNTREWTNPWQPIPNIRNRSYFAQDRDSTIVINDEIYIKWREEQDSTYMENNFDQAFTTSGATHDLFDSTYLSQNPYFGLIEDGGFDSLGNVFTVSDGKLVRLKTGTATGNDKERVLNVAVPIPTIEQNIYGSFGTEYMTWGDIDSFSVMFYKVEGLTSGDSLKDAWFTIDVSNYVSGGSKIVMPTSIEYWNADTLTSRTEWNDTSSYSPYYHELRNAQIVKVTARFYEVLGGATGREEGHTLYHVAAEYLDSTTLRSTNTYMNAYRANTSAEVTVYVSDSADFTIDGIKSQYYSSMNHWWNFEKPLVVSEFDGVVRSKGDKERILWEIEQPIEGINRNDGDVPITAEASGFHRVRIEQLGQEAITGGVTFISDFDTIPAFQYAFFDSSIATVFSIVTGASIASADWGDRVVTDSINNWKTQNGQSMVFDSLPDIAGVDIQMYSFSMDAPKDSSLFGCEIDSIVWTFYNNAVVTADTNDARYPIALMLLYDGTRKIFTDQWETIYNFGPTSEFDWGIRQGASSTWTIKPDVSADGVFCGTDFSDFTFQCVDGRDIDSFVLHLVMTDSAWVTSDYVEAQAYSDCSNTRTSPVFTHADLSIGPDGILSNPIYKAGGIDDRGGLVDTIRGVQVKPTTLVTGDVASMSFYGHDESNPSFTEYYHAENGAGGMIGRFGGFLNQTAQESLWSIGDWATSGSTFRFVVDIIGNQIFMSSKLGTYERYLGINSTNVTFFSKNQSTLDSSYVSVDDTRAITSADTIYESANDFAQIAVGTGDSATQVVLEEDSLLLEAITLRIDVAPFVAGGVLTDPTGTAFATWKVPPSSSYVAELDSTDYTANSDTLFIVYDLIKLAGNTVTLPNTNTTNVIYTVKDLSGSARNITVTVAGGGTVDGNPSHVIPGAKGSYRYKYISTGKYAIF